MIHCRACSTCSPGKCRIFADTKCDARCSATSPRCESVTTATFLMCFWWSRTKRKWVTIAPKLSQPGNAGALIDEAGKIASCFDLGVNRLCQLDEIVLVERGLRSHLQDGMRGIQLVVDHVLLLNDCCCGDGGGRGAWFLHGALSRNAQEEAKVIDEGQ
jgi:hypothetical protein